MRKTFQNRRNWISETMPSVMQILERYPRFQDTPTVVQQELNLLLPEASAKLISKWETRFVQSVFHICQMSRLPKIQASMKDLFHPVSESGDQYTPSDGEMSLYMLSLVLCTSFQFHLMQQKGHPWLMQYSASW